MTKKPEQETEEQEESGEDEDAPDEEEVAELPETSSAVEVRVDEEPDPDLEWFKNQAAEVLQKSEKRLFGPAIKGLRAFFKTMKED